jgi:hypothetical protein
MLEGGEIKDGCRRAVAAVVVATAVSLCVCAAALASGDVNSAACSPATESSPGFRSYLPDCRAFELVSPPFVAGAVPLGTGSKREPPLMTADGEHVLSLVFGGLAGTEGLEQNAFAYGAYYEFSRTPAGWSAEALSPPDSLYARYEFAFASSDFSRSLWSVEQAPAPGEELPIGAPPEDPNGNVDGFNYPNNGTLVIREAAGGGKGRFIVVGPVTAPGHEPTSRHEGFEPIGASADLSHVLLDVEAKLKQLWPGDQTVANAQSLYEYVGTGDREPALVGVRNEGHLDGTPYVNDGADLISHCGTVLGAWRAAGGSIANAISASGERTFFTAMACAENPGEPEVDELYARVDGERTVDISEPSLATPGRECTGACREDEEDPAKESQGTFQGASEEGTKVFFTSQQPLVNEATGGGPYLYEETIAGKGLSANVTSLRLIAPEVEGAPVISEDGGRVYFQSLAVLSGAATNGNGEPAQPGVQHTYLYDTETAKPGEPPVFVAQQAGEERTTRDGGFLVFESPVHVAGTNDSSGIPQLFEYDAETGVIVRVSVGQSSPSGYECEATHVVEARYGCDGNAATGGYELPFSLAQSEGSAWSPTDATSGLAVASDGVVEFESQNALTPLAVPGKENVYEYRDGNVYLLSPGDEAVATLYESSRLLGIGESGQDAFFETTEGLLPQDTDTQASWYDAREAGGFPASPATPACAGEACQGPGPAAPTLSSPLTPPTADENLVEPATVKPTVKPKAKPKAKPCKKGFTKKRGRCVKAKGRKANRATNDRRAQG